MEWRYRGRTVTAEEIAFIRRLIAENPEASRRRLSEKLCEAWQWKQANGAPRDMICHGLLLMLHRAREIEFTTARLSASRHFRVFPYPKEAESTLPRGPPESLGMERSKTRLQRRRLDVQSLVARKSKRKSWPSRRRVVWVPRGGDSHCLSSCSP